LNSFARTIGPAQFEQRNRRSSVIVYQAISDLKSRIQALGHPGNTRRSHVGDFSGRAYRIRSILQVRNSKKWGRSGLVFPNFL
jgi:hypothetical protein